mgnify:CR=1 FL=1
MEKAAEGRFWDCCIQLARQEEVPEKALRWYLRRVEQYVQAHTNKQLRKHVASDGGLRRARTPLPRKRERGIWRYGDINLGG